MYVLINDPISVVAVFSSGKIIPKFFIWKRKKFSVEEVTFFWRSKNGSDRILHFAVTTSDSVYEISYNLKTSAWRLEKAYVA